MIPDVVIHFTVDGKQKTLNFRKVPLAVWMQLTGHPGGFTPQTLLTGIAIMDVRAILAALWLEKCQRNRRESYAALRRDLMDGPVPEIMFGTFTVDGRTVQGDDDDEAVETGEGEEADPDPLDGTG